jgi:hypothetical protein
MGAFFAAKPQKTGLFAPIFFAAKRQKRISAAIPCAAFGRAANLRMQIRDQLLARWDLRESGP